MVTDPEVYPRLVEEIGGNPQQFMAMFMSPEAADLVWEDFAIVRSWGVTSFPTVIFREGDTGNIIAEGYATAETMLAIVDELSDVSFSESEDSGHAEPDR
jgi:protein-disulfide isomerase-like protein with CxxC motif